MPKILLVRFFSGHGVYVYFTSLLSVPVLTAEYLTLNYSKNSYIFIGFVVLIMYDFCQQTICV